MSKNVFLNYERLKNTKYKLNVEDNCRLRDALWIAGYDSNEVGMLIKAACKHDIRYFVNFFCWVFEARGNEEHDRCLPFITWDFQDDALTNLVEASMTKTGKVADRLIEKSRDMGASWMCIVLCVWAWLFHGGIIIKIISRSEDLVDSRGDVNSLFGKIMYIVERLPGWMKPMSASRYAETNYWYSKKADVLGYDKTHMQLVNMENQSAITGAATSSDAARGARSKFMVMDEFASVENIQQSMGNALLKATRPVTDCRIFNSTPNGIKTAFYSMRGSMNKKNIITLHWSLHPKKNAGLYRVKDNGDVEIIDKGWHRKHPGYEFILEPGGWEGLRSPWYDEQCARTPSKVEIAQEEDINYHGSGGAYFDPSTVSRCLNEDCRTPAIVTTPGKYLGIEKTYNDKKQSGSWRCWLETHPSAMEDLFVVSVDISTGMGASDSAIVVASAWRKEKVAEYSSNLIPSEYLSELTADVARHFSTACGMAYVIWDQGGEGKAFGRRLIEDEGYKHVYYYKNPDTLKMSDRPGYPSNQDLKKYLFSQYRLALAEGRYINRSKEAVKQCREYIFGPGAVPTHVNSTSDDPSDNKQSHGDIAYADAMAVLAIHDLPEPKKAERVILPGSLAYRRREEKRQQERISSFFS